MSAMAPSCKRLRVSYTVSDSMSCIRRAKENGSENLSDKRAAVGPVFPSAPQDGISSHDQSFRWLFRWVLRFVRIPFVLLWAR